MHAEFKRESFYPHRKMQIPDRIWMDKYTIYQPVLLVSSIVCLVYMSRVMLIIFI